MASATLRQIGYVVTFSQYEGGILSYNSPPKFGDLLLHDHSASPTLNGLTVRQLEHDDEIWLGGVAARYSLSAPSSLRDWINDAFGPGFVSQFALDHLDAPVPERGTDCLLGFGLIGPASQRRRRAERYGSASPTEARSRAVASQLDGLSCEEPSGTRRVQDGAVATHRGPEPRTAPLERSSPCTRPYSGVPMPRMEGPTLRETTIVSADGTELAARCSGNGSPLVLVHGALSDLNAFALVEGLLAQQHSVWVYSRRGRGGSGDGPDYRMEREVEDVLAVLGAAGDGAHLLGHSLGAIFALLAASRAPSLRSLVLYEPPLRGDRAGAGLLDGLESAVDAGDADRALETFFPVANIAAEEVEALRAQAPLWEMLRQGVLVFPRELRGLQADGTRLLSAAQLPDVPLLYLHGEKTEAPVYPSPAEISALFPRARLHALAGQRHLAPFFDPAAFAQAVLDFTVVHEG